MVKNTTRDLYALQLNLMISFAQAPLQQTDGVNPQVHGLPK